MSNVVPHPKNHSWQEWSKLIHAAWQDGVASIVKTGRLLVDAQNDPSMKHGSWEAMVQTKLPFTPRTAQRLMAIANHPIISNATHASLLPPRWDTLYQLSRLKPETIEAYIKDGTITPKLERKDAVKLLPPPKKKSSKKKLPPDLGKARAAHAAAVEHLSKDERRREIWKTVAAFGLELRDFFTEITIQK